MKKPPNLNLVLLFALATAVSGQERKFDWSAPPLESRSPLVTVVSEGARSCLRIANTNETPLQARLLTIEAPGISAEMYAVTGEVKYENVQGDGYLEMWSVFPKGRFFSRTMGASGLMGKISGSSDWRPFSLPFNRTGSSNAPTRLEINLFLPGRGTVLVAPVTLTQFPKARDVGDVLYPRAWWSARAGSLIGGIAGGLLGCFGGLLGLLASRGKAGKFVMASAKCLLALGGLCGIAALVALADHQPNQVWYPPALVGVILLAIMARALSQFRRRYSELEMRRMASVDAQGG
ncbi:MAG: hypothetical protein ABSA47_03710 [Verrucomicrobiota bacterium]|jgi:hypothetical protein